MVENINSNTVFKTEPIKTFTELKSILSNSGINYDLDRINDAFEFAEKIHRDQKRISGEDYINHVLAVTGYVAQLNLDTTTIVCALLHDSVEKANVSIDLIDKKFGTEVSFIVDGLTQIQKLTKSVNNEDVESENLRHLIFNATEDIRILIIRIAEKLHNLLMSEGVPFEIQRVAAKKALNIYAPLAEYLGLGYFQRNLEDLGFKIVYPEEYKIVSTTIEEYFKDSQDIMGAFIKEVKEILDTYNIDYVDVKSRKKGIYSTFKKTKRKFSLSREQITSENVRALKDIYAARIIVNTVEQCYMVLGLIHGKWEYDKEEFDDYISKPKASGYKSLQTAIKFMNTYFEVQIRTQEMHEYNEFGPASHIAYKLRGSVNAGQSFTWTKDLVKWRESKDLNKEDFKINAFSNSIFVFTPKGLVVRLDKGSHPLDFAFRIHTQIGHNYLGAKVNGKMVSMDCVLKTGDIVEIMTSKNSSANLDWLKYAKMSETKSRVKRVLNRY